MQNLDQIRAAAALRALKNDPFDRNDVAGLPSLILTNGLLSAAAFCCETKEARTGRKAAFDAIAEYLKERKLTTASTGTALIADLSTKDNLTLQRATTEALALLSYLKRFAKKKEC